MAVLGWMVEVCSADGDPITRQIPSSLGNKFCSFSFIHHSDHIQMHWWPFFNQRYAVYYYLVDGKKILKEERFSTQCRSVPSCSLCPSRGKTAASGPSLGFVLSTYFTFLVTFRGCCLHNASICVKLQWNVCHCRGWLIQGSKSLSRCSGSSPRRR